MLHSQNKTLCNWSADENIVSTMFEKHSLKNGRVFCNRSRSMSEANNMNSQELASDIERCEFMFT